MGLKSNQCKHLKRPDPQMWQGIDKFKAMLDRQREINKMFMPTNLVSEDDKRMWTTRMKLAMDGEMAELMEACEFKWWARRKGIDEVELKYEVVDLFHFMLSMILLWFEDENEFLSYYMAKAQENVDRQKRGY